ncbi:aquaporin-10 isoform X2 [Accipiter gentilis]|uniref:aquaporin-10 isoform X2 n=1 Tax=Astur gentilis TaxID=8957 RepID=UPI00210F50DE|nr:aquaporin-10 isoform X2 [Accipiter gentilis]
MGTTSFLKRAQALLHIRNQLVRECLAELLAVFVLILITLSGSAQMVTSSGTKGNILTTYLAGALAVMVAIYTAGGVSGAHLNPAFSLAMCLLEQFPWWKLPIFVAVQTSGAFISAGAVYALYYGTGRWAGAWQGNTAVVPGWLGSQTGSDSAPQMPSSTTATGPSPPLAPGKPPPSLPPTLLTISPSPMASWTSPTGDGHSTADRGHPGHSGHPEQGCPQGPGAGGRGPAGVLHRGLHGLKLRLPHEPRTGFWAPALHLHCGLGRRGLQQGQWVVVGAGGGTTAGGRSGLGPLPAPRGFPPPTGGG